jgi:hypothetical protein
MASKNCFVLVRPRALNWIDNRKIYKVGAKKAQKAAGFVDQSPFTVEMRLHLA